MKKVGAVLVAAAAITLAAGCDDGSPTYVQPSGYYPQQPGYYPQDPGYYPQQPGSGGWVPDRYPGSDTGIGDQDGGINVGGGDDRWNPSPACGPLTPGC